MSETAAKNANELLTVETRGLLFDMDGVLISSTGSVVRCWQRWCKLYGVPNAAQFHVPHGTRAVDIVRMLKPEFDEAQVDQLMDGDHIRRQMRLVAIQRASPDVSKRLLERGGEASGTRLRAAEVAFQHLTHRRPVDSRIAIVIEWPQLLGSLERDRAERGHKSSVGPVNGTSAFFPL